MIKAITINDYEELFEVWKNTPDMGLRSLDDSKKGITRVCLNVMETNEQGKKFWVSKGWEKKDFLGFTVKR